MAPFFRYISAHEIRSKHQLLVVAGPIIGAWYFWYGFQKEAGSSKGANFFAKNFGNPAKNLKLTQTTKKKGI